MKEELFSDFLLKIKLRDKTQICLKLNSVSIDYFPEVKLFLDFQLILLSAIKMC
jgi:hypothetical protein